MKKLDKKLLELLNSTYPLSEKNLAQITNYLELLLHWNQAYNLTSVRDPEEMITRHIFDSLSIQNYLSGENVLDVGTGAGLPGIPLAIVEPQRKFVLLDSNGKKTRFLTQVLLTLKLDNVTVIQSRVEKFTTEHCFTTIMSRAFSSILEFVSLTKHLCCPDGSWLAMKGEYPQEELSELGEEYSTIVYDLPVPGLAAKRHLAVIKQTSARSSVG